jgi:anthranilate/para-aminobenzoate synthase component I
MSHWQSVDAPAWQEPLAFASRFSGRDMAFLYSGLREAFTGSVSYLFIDPIEEIAGSDWAALPPLADENDGLPLWVGYLGYGLQGEAARGAPSPVHLPDFRLVRYAHMWRFDHARQHIDAYSQTGAALTLHAAPAPLSAIPAVSELASNFTRSTYKSIVADTIEQIRDGNFYQANITRKFYGAFTETPDSWQVFTRLTAASPAPYSAYIRHGDTAILSSSPECFLSITADGTMTTRPIKGSARRSDDAAEDKKIREQLAHSEKNHAENLMIVDLMRNDLARVAEPMSVAVIEQAALYSYRTIHHLISTIRAKKLPHISAYEAVRACFPAGSMTGAPKIAAMRWCAAQEAMERGVYSGAIGWFGGGNSCDLSVVIRTIIIDSKRFEFQVGGGIVAESTPDDEWRETMTKARGILAAIGLTEEDLIAL